MRVGIYHGVIANTECGWIDSGAAHDVVSIQSHCRERDACSLNNRNHLRRCILTNGGGKTVWVEVDWVGKRVDIGGGNTLGTAVAVGDCESDVVTRLNVRYSVRCCACADRISIQKPLVGIDRPRNKSGCNGQ